MSGYKGLHDPNFLKEIVGLSNKDMMDAANHIYNTLLDLEEEALNDPEDPEIKIVALTEILKFFEEHEEYEKCIFISKLINRISGKK
jgi:hypothetical protein